MELYLYHFCLKFVTWFRRYQIGPVHSLSYDGAVSTESIEELQTIVFLLPIEWTQLFLSSLEFRTIIISRSIYTYRNKVCICFFID